MENQDKLSKYFKELPGEEPSVNFTMMVMDRVRAESKRPAPEYSPLIGARVWWTISILIVLSVFGAAMVNSLFPGKEFPASLQILQNLDFSIVTKPFTLLSGALSHLSVTHLFVLMGIFVLLLFDNLYSRFAR